ncbi:MAG: Flp family type IVb pilin [Planctomycetes bacterium]|jgi:Flp pilus assembly pilin Flp|nr:Flp family type IVb pilin [Planctomycetota bacterium]
MSNAIRKFAAVAKSLYRDEQGANMVEYILIIAAVALPLLAVVLWYRNEISEWASEKWNDIRGVDDPVTP